MELYARRCVMLEHSYCSALFCHCYDEGDVMLFAHWMCILAHANAVVARAHVLNDRNVILVLAAVRGFL